MEGLSKKGKELMDMDNSVGIVWGGRVEVEKDIRGINGNGKKYNGNKFFKNP